MIVEISVRNERKCKEGRRREQGPYGGETREQSGVKTQRGG